MTQATNYDDFAEAYAAENESSMLNAYYERPAMIDLAGNVRGHRILDAGCGAGPLSEKLIEAGAEVVGFDSSQEMIEIARRRLGDRVDLRVANLGDALPYADDSFDEVMVSLVFHYLEDWSRALGEIRRVLKPGGRLIMSVNHPFAYPYTNPGKDYFVPVQYTDEHNFSGEPAELTYWHRPLHAMADAFIQAGFQIEKIAEPPYSKEAPTELIPPPFRDREAFLSFLFFELSAG